MLKHRKVLIELWCECGLDRIYENISNLMSASMETLHRSKTHPTLWPHTSAWYIPGNTNISYRRDNANATWSLQHPAVKFN